MGVEGASERQSYKVAGREKEEQARQKEIELVSKIKVGDKRVGKQQDCELTSNTET